VAYWNHRDILTKCSCQLTRTVNTDSWLPLSITTHTTSVTFWHTQGSRQCTANDCSSLLQLVTCICVRCTVWLTNCVK
jgi:hypothetical protein